MQLNYPDAVRLANTCDTFGVPIPDGVTQAAKTKDAAHALCDQIAAETPPDIASVTAGNMSKVHEAMVRWETRAQRLASAQQLKDAADVAYVDAWWHVCGSLPESFADAFADAMKRFVENLAALDGNPDAAAATRTNRAKEHNAMTDAAAEVAELAHLWRITRASSSPVAVGSTSRQGLPQLIHVDSIDALNKVWGNYQTASNLWSAEWLAQTLAMPGVHIAWPERGNYQTSDDIYAIQRANAQAK